MIGSKLSSVKIIIWLLVSLLIGIFSSYFLILLSKSGFYFLIPMLALIVILIIYPTIISCLNNYWYIKQSELCYLTLENNLQKWKYTIYKLFNKESLLEKKNMYKRNRIYDIKNFKAILHV